MNHDQKYSIEQLKKIMDKFVEERNWRKYHTPKELSVALSVEAGELLELFLFKNSNKDEIISNEKLMSELMDEIADIFAYLLSIVNALDIDLTYAFLEKMKKNEFKYPTSEFNGNYKKK